MKKIIICFVAMFLAGCNSPAPESATSKSKTDNWFEVSNSKCAYVAVDEMPCIFCENRVHAGYAPALTCDWSKSKMERTK